MAVAAGAFHILSKCGEDPLIMAVSVGDHGGGGGGLSNVVRTPLSWRWRRGIKAVVAGAFHILSKYGEGGGEPPYHGRWRRGRCILSNVVDNLLL